MNDNPVFERIGAEISENDVVLFMKGTPQFPQCGFSAAVVEVLSQIGVPFTAVNVLDDDARFVVGGSVVVSHFAEAPVNKGFTLLKSLYPTTTFNAI